MKSRVQTVMEHVVGSLPGSLRSPMFAQETVIVDGKEITRPVLTNARCTPTVIRPRKYKRGRGKKTYRSTRACSVCHGACCKQLPGCAMPRDFGRIKLAILAGVRSALLTERWALDWWEGDPRTKSERKRVPAVETFYFVRPAVKGKEGELYHGAWSGECTFLTDSGCELPTQKRPRECRLLEPRPGGAGNCVPHGASKRQASVAWVRYGLGIVADDVEKERTVRA